MGSYVADPLAWHVNLSSTLLLADLWDIAGPHLLAFLSGGIFAAFMAIGWAFLAPLLWIVAFGTFFWFLPSLVADRPDYPRDVRRHHHRPKNRNQKRRSGSIRDHGFHKSYPRHLRARGHYFQQAPTMEERVMHDQVSRLHSHVLRLQSELTRLRADCGPRKGSTSRKKGSSSTVRKDNTTTFGLSGQGSNKGIVASVGQTNQKPSIALCLLPPTTTMAT